MSTERVVREAPDSLPTHGVGLPEAALSWLDIDDGDVVTVDGVTAGVVVTVSGGADDAVYLSALVRENAGLEPGENATLAVAEVRAASALRLRLSQTFDVERVEEVVRKRLEGVPVSTGDRIEVTLLGGGLTLELTVEAVEPTSPALVGDATDVVVEGAEDEGATAVPSASYEDIPGREEPMADLDRLAAARFGRADTFGAVDRPPGAGVLLHGPAGTGRRDLVEALAAEHDATYLTVDTGTLLGTDGGDRPEEIREGAAEADRTVVLLAGLEALESDSGRLTAELGGLVEDLRAEPGTVVVGTATGAGAVPDPLRRGGRLDRDIGLDALDREGREAVLAAHLADVRTEGVDLESVAGATHGFVAADLGAVVDRAVEHAAERATDRERVVLREEDLDRALERVDPSGLRDMSIDFPEVSWDDVGGLEAAKREVIRAVHWPLTYPDFFAEAGVDPPRGVLLYGPPGTGKTLLARAVAGISDANFVSVKGPELLDRYVGASEQAVRDLFETARRNAPTVIFFDEIDALSPERRDGDSDVSERVVSQLLTELDGVEPLEQVFVVAATNRPDMIDDALLRPGRLEKAVETPLPDRAARAEILRIHTDGMPLQGGVDLERLADRTEGFSGGDLAALVREAAMLAIERTVTDDHEITVGPDQFEAALERVTPSVDAEAREAYAAFD